MAVGFVKIFRTLQEHPLWLSEPFTKGQAWVDLLTLANFKDGFLLVRGLKVPIRRGEVGWSEVKLAKRWQWSRGKIRRFLVHLEEEQMVDIKKDNKTTIITICNYNKFQRQVKAGRTANDAADGTANGIVDGTADGTADGTLIKKEEKGKKERMKKSISSAPPHADTPLVCSLLLNDGSKFEVHQGYVDQLAVLYPAVKVEQECRNMAGWSLSNIEKRKTRKGVQRFITNWLQREQDRHPSTGTKNTRNPRRDRPIQPRILEYEEPENMDIPY